MIPLGRGTGDGEDPGFGPETAGIIVIESQVEELAGLEAGQWPLGCKINGIDVITVIQYAFNPTANFLWDCHNSNISAIQCLQRDFINLNLHTLSFHEPSEYRFHPIQLFIRNTRVNPNKKSIIHYGICIIQVTDNLV